MMFKTQTSVTSHYNLVRGDDYSTYDENPFRGPGLGNSVWQNPYHKEPWIYPNDEDFMSTDYDNLQRLEELIRIWEDAEHQENTESDTFI